MRVEAASAGGYVPPMIDAAEFTKAVVGAATETTKVALELTQVAAGPASEDAPVPTAEDIAALQHAIGMAHGG